MRKYYFIAIFFLFHAHSITGQKYYSKVGRIHFLSEAPLEKIEATNHNALVIFDASTGKLECSVLIKGFQFEKALMQDHFNENYMESHKYPKGIFKGSVLNMDEVNLNKDGTFPVNVKGDLTLHGVTNPFILVGQIVVKAGKISASSAFDILLDDYNIQIPKVVKENVSKTVKVTVAADLQKME
jgi:polyisoprenoid-binding protein YceI